MNYNSINEIFAAGTTNMQILRNNTKQDDGSDTVEGVSWFSFGDYTSVSSISVNGNSYFSFGNSWDENLKVNRRDCAMYYLYREEGTLYNLYKFLKIRWCGYSYWNSTSSENLMEYDVILWDTGDISLHMVTFPTVDNSGEYYLYHMYDYFYYNISDTNPDVTFIKNGSSFNVVESVIDLKAPFKERYLIRSGSDYYTIVDNTLSQISSTEITSDVFLNSGIDYLPSLSSLSGLSNPEILYWTENQQFLFEKGLVITGTPKFPQIAYYETQDISSFSGIEKAEVVASDDVLFTITFDEGQTWKYYNNGTWNVATSETEGMTASTIKNITSNGWSEVVTSKMFSFRCALQSVDSTVSKIYIKYI